MITSYIDSTMMPRNLAAGQISGEVFEKSTTEIFTVSKFSDKETANKIMGLMKDEIREIAKGCKMSLLEGPRIIQGKSSLE
ncbi:MAG: hypothetical protein P8M09_02530 [Paracoccaceae bacterium]|nr:hypothetical protein [Paracoccaceae bacterium]